MRRALLIVLLAGCPGGGGNSGECQTDADCAGEVCANTHECLPSDQVHRVAVHWTLNGKTPTAALCAPAPTFDLTIAVNATGDGSTYSPIACTEGEFDFPALPTRYDSVTLVAEANADQGTAAIPASGGDITIDMPFGFADAAPP